MFNFYNKKNIFSRIFGVIWPYCLMFLGLFIVFVIPVTFYNPNNLDVTNINITNLPQSINSEYVGGDEYVVSLPLSQPITPLAKNDSKYEGDLSAKAVYVYDVKSKKVLFKKNENNIRPLASITKLMSALILLEQDIDWSSSTTISSLDGNGDNIVDVGEKFTLDDLWSAGLVGSSNRAIMALVRNSGLTEDGFVMLMNKRAKELGFESLVFSEPTGLSAVNKGNTKDVAKLLKEAIHFEKIYNTIQLSEVFIKPLESEKYRRVYSTNWLLSGWIPNDFGDEKIAGKTGHIEESGYNFASSFTSSNNRQIICVILGAQSNEKRFEECRDVLKFVFNKYVWPNAPEFHKLIE